MEKILEKINKLNQHFRREEKSEQERFLERIVKLNEEVGELCEAALYETDTNNLSYKNKQTDFDSELADVIICALMLSTQRNANVMEQIDKKLEAIINRLNLQ